MMPTIHAVRAMLFTCLLVPMLACAQGPDIDAMLAAPFPDAPVAAAQAPVLAWSANVRGVRNLWVARAPDFVPRQRTAYDADDGQAMTALQLSADGRWLAYVRGAPGAGGLAVDPANTPDGTERAVWLVATDGRSPPRRIDAGGSPLFSPRGDVLLVQGAQGIDCHAVAESAHAPDGCRDALIKLPGLNRAAAFSPDGARLAFVSDRGDHAFVGVLDLHARTVQWMAPDFDRDGSPAWSPDGKHVAFVRSPGLGNDDKFDVTATQAFEIWTADAASGIGRRLFRSGPHAGGYAQFAVDMPLRWSRDGRIVFASEETGWLHWYALSSDGGAPQALSRGECEADSAALADAGEMIFSGNCEGIDHRQLFAVDAKGSAQKRLTARDAIATDPVLLSDGHWIAFRHADARLPTAIAVLQSGAGEPRRIFPTILPSDFPSADLVVPKTLILRAADGVVSHAQLFESAQAHAGKRAAILYVHGGPIRQMLPGWMPMDYYNHDYANNQWLASQGYVVLSSNYRAGTGYGQAFRTAKRQGPRGASEYEDVLAARAYLAALPDVDAKRIGIYGGSYGGYLTAQALARDSDLFAAGVDRHGVHDWRESAKGGDNSGLWGLRADELELAWRSSPVARLDGWRSPVLVVHGDDDSAVKFAQGTDLVARLRARGVPVETLVVPGEEHMFLRHATWLQVYRRSADFLRRTLQP